MIKIPVRRFDIINTATRPQKVGWLLLSEYFLDLSPLAWDCVWLQGGDEMKNINELRIRARSLCIGIQNRPAVGVRGACGQDK